MALLSMFFLLLSVPAFAQTDDVDDTTADVVTTEVVVEGEFEGLDIEEPEKLPGGFGLFWKSVRERVTIGFTFDPVAKAEKRLQFAEERIRMAERFAERTDDPKAQERLDRAVERANILVEKIEEKREDWLAREDERAKRLLRNVVTHHDRREQIFDRIEERIPESRREAFELQREDLVNRSRRLMNAIENEDIPEDVRLHLEDVKERIENHAQIMEEHRDAVGALRGAAAVGDEDARAALETLREQRKVQLEKNREEYRERIDVRREDRQDDVRERGDTRAVERDEQAEDGDRQSQPLPSPLKERVEVQENIRGEVRMRSEVLREEDDLKARGEVRTRVETRLRDGQVEVRDRREERVR
ncbi:MAG: hypothetical protein COU33_00880 [Candidatus Magasanikbacteria bacterium CG10_big_fil_rev_8_21_14_0_10_43_6]|uniref:DUF5667 domain-containing protein n=1 Tax=Candidatus Magasanikbacteria bacterium CG10_big_fil_rev_8_21_14_0_10_43_6 TaxID=1974650 RepID=A0A2M6W224_9BACT|nr:MAG: hypothetical protein COU33_00880 [Candidatus Magasanikbacteria bacterium CG10_big_fil_rev_8_21_14_0_10_43_6]